MDDEKTPQGDTEKPRLKVTDRRKFAADGSLRSVDEPSTEPDGETAAAGSPIAPPNTETTSAEAAPEAGPGPDSADEAHAVESAEAPGDDASATVATETPDDRTGAAERTAPEGADGADDDPRIAGPEPGFSQLPRDFTAFVESMYLEAMLYMGAIADPRTGETIEDVELAKYKIDLLIMLQEKTEGNLTTEEKQQFDDALYQLRMLYLQKTKTASL